jgi:hypothetical protein
VCELIHEVFFGSGASCTAWGIHMVHGQAVHYHVYDTSAASAEWPWRGGQRCASFPCVMHTLELYHGLVGGGGTLPSILERAVPSTWLQVGVQAGLSDGTLARLADGTIRAVILTKTEINPCFQAMAMTAGDKMHTARRVVRNDFSLACAYYCNLGGRLPTVAGSCLAGLGAAPWRALCSSAISAGTRTSQTVPISHAAAPLCVVESAVAAGGAGAVPAAPAHSHVPWATASELIRADVAGKIEQAADKASSWVSPLINWRLHTG